MGPGEERISASWTDARDAFAYGEEGSVFVRRIGEEEAVDVTASHRAREADDETDTEGGGTARVARGGCGRQGRHRRRSE